MYYMKRYSEKNVNEMLARYYSFLINQNMYKYKSMHINKYKQLTKHDKKYKKK